ncbi:MAG: alcohol dehydrogenase catalytic domain-containing protein [bacterium]|nr:alcohol dehydrogenase catalytic domain-containing protein [bacterium]
MKALVLKSPRNLAVMDVPKPRIGPGQMLVKVLKCGICGSDVRYYHGDNPWAKHTLGRDVPNPPNMVLGHEFLGVVAEVGDPADAPWIGKRVAVNSFLSCGRCSLCREYRENLCPDTRHVGHGQGWGAMDFYPGAMAEYCPAFSDYVFELPPWVTDDHATLLDPLIVAIHAAEVAGLKPLDRMAVLGAGPIGLLIGQVARVGGASWTCITDIGDDNIAVARQVGFDDAVRVPEDDNRALIDLVMAKTAGEGVHAVFDTVGSAESVAAALTILRKGGTLVLMAAREEEIRIPAHLLSAERAIKTSSNSRYADFPKAVEMVSRNMLNLEPLITHRFPLTQGLAAFDVAANKAASGAIKVVLDCQA